MTPEERLEAAALASSATPGPWYVETVGAHSDDEAYIVADVASWRGYTNALNFGEDKATADFVAWCRAGVPQLVNDANTLQAERDEAIEQLRSLFNAVLMSPVSDDWSNDSPEFKGAVGFLDRHDKRAARS